MQEEIVAGVVRSLGLNGQKARVAAGLIRGRMLKEIAGELDISTSTVKTLCTRVYSSVHVGDRREFSALAFERLAARRPEVVNRGTTIRLALPRLRSGKSAARRGVSRDSNIRAEERT